MPGGGMPGEANIQSGCGGMPAAPRGGGRYAGATSQPPPSPLALDMSQKKGAPFNFAPCW